jgi:predicted MPP superfamily phosphohydrolase
MANQRKNILKIAIISDLHAYSNPGEKKQPSFLFVGDPEDNWRQHPIGGLLKLIQDFESSGQGRLTADLLIAPGDLGNGADPQGIKYVWSALDRIKAKLSAHLVVATTGNHDVDSRNKFNKYDPLDALKTLTPPYPLPDENLNNHYWAKHYCIVENSDYRLIVLNSSAFHATSKEELERGRVSPTTLAEISQTLSASEPKAANILLCHHHPQQHSELKLGEYDWMRDGQELLDLLGTGALGSWLIIHGHKHHPKLSYASGSSASPIILSAGSFSAHLYPLLSTSVRNQFYILELDLDRRHQFGLVGRGQSWFWSGSDGWIPSTTGAGIPAKFGFGYRENRVSLANRVSKTVKTRVLKWRAIVDKFPELQYMTPLDLKAFAGTLHELHKVLLSFDSKDCPYEIGPEI